MNKFRKFTDWLRRPHGWPLVAHYVAAVLLITAATLLAALGYNTKLEILAYILFGCAAVSLGYTVYTVVYFAPKIKKRMITWAEKYEFTSKLVHKYGFRTIILSVGSLVVSTGYALFNGVIAVLSLSVWYGALASYYILLATMRGAVIFYHRKKGKYADETEWEKQIRETKIYRTCGGLLIFLPLCLSGAVTQMVLSRRAYQYAGLMIYAAAAYTFYKIVMSIVNLVKAHKTDDDTVRAVRNVNFADALVSLLALQTAMFRAFAPEADLGYANAIMGGAVCLLTVLLGIFMVCNANKKIRRTAAQIAAAPDPTAQPLETAQESAAQSNSTQEK